MATIATLTVDMLLKNDKLRIGLRKSSKDVKSFSARVRDNVNKANRAFKVMSVGAVGALSAIYVQAAKSGDQLAKLSDEIGETPEKLTALSYAADLSGSSTEVMNKSLEQMSKRIGEAIKGTGEAKDYLDRLGLSTQAFYSLSPAEQFKAIADATGNLATQQEKAAAANALFGRTGIQLINTLALGSQGLTAMETEAQKLGITLTRVDLAKIEAANDSFLRAQKTTSAFGKSLAVELAPFVGAISNQFVESAKEAGGFGAVAQRVIAGAARGVGILSNGVHGLNILWVSAKAAVANWWGFLANKINSADALLTAFLNKIPGVAVKQSEFLQRATESISSVADDINTELQEKLLAPLPSQKINTWIEDVQKKAQKAAEQVAAKRKTQIGVEFTDSPLQKNPGDADRVREENEKIISLTKERFRRINEEALLAQGKTVELERLRFQREQQAMQVDIQRLQQRGLLTSEIQQQARTAEEQAEEIHQQKMLTIKQASLQKEREINFAKAQLVSDVIGLGMSLVGDTSKNYKRLARIQKVAAVYQSGLKLQEAIANANAVPWPANIPAIIKATSVGAGAISQIKSLKQPSFEGGGFTGSGPRSGGVDGHGGFPAIVHPDEYIFDSRKNKGGLSPTVIINNYGNETVQARVDDKNQLIIDVAVKQYEQNFQRQMLGGGPMADAMVSGFGLKRQARR